MKKLFTFLMLAMLICFAGAPALAEAIPEAEPLTWAYLATIGGATAFTLLVVQFTKVPLDKVWKIPTRLYAYVIALSVMLVATAFTGGLTFDNALLAACNAVLAALSAYGMYEMTFAKVDKPPEEMRLDG